MRNLYKAILLAVGLTVLIALPVLAYTYRASYTVTENASNTYTMLPVMTNSKNSWMASNGFMLSTAMDTRVETLGGLVKPHMVTDNRTLTAIPVSANSQTNLYFTTGSANLSNMSIITGYGGTINVTDAVGIEMGSNFTHSITGWVDTTASANKTLLYKPGAVTTNITGTGNITSTIQLSANYSANISPGGAGFVTGIANLVGAATHWQAVLTNDGATSYVSIISNTTEQDDLYTVSGLNSYRNLTITNLTVFIVYDCVGGAQGYVYPLIRTGGTTYSGSSAILSGTGTQNTSWVINPQTGVTWTTSDIDGLQIGTGLACRNGAGEEVRVTQVYATVTFANTIALTATGISTGEHTVVTSLNSPSGNYSILVDGVVKNTITTNGSISVANTANDWLVFAANTTPYATSITLAVNGTQVLWYSPNNVITGTVLPNRASTSNNATINFGANPAGVNIVLGSMVSTGQPVISQVTDTPAIDVMPDIVVTNWSHDPAVSTTLQNSPFRPLVKMVSDPSTLTEQQAWRWWGIAVVLGLTIWAAKITHGHWLITGIVAGAVFGAETAYTIWPWWGLLFVAMCVAAGALAQTELGTNRGQ